MIALKDLLDVAETHVRVVLEKLKMGSLVPTWLLVNQKDQVQLVGTPWEDDAQKEAIARMLRKKMRTDSIVAYSFITEAWMAAGEEGIDYTEPVPEEKRARSRVDRIEVVLAFATDGKEQQSRSWAIKRDYLERINGLEPIDELPGAKEGWMIELLSK